MVLAFASENGPATVMGPLMMAALFAGAATAAGVVLLALGLLARPAGRPGTATISAMRGGRVARDRGPLRRVVLAVAVGAVTLAVTRWPAPAVVAALAVWGLPVLFSAPREAARGIDRVEAVEEWVRRLADVLVVGVGLGQAVVTTARAAPEALRPELAALTARIAARWPLEDALRAFADDVDDPAGDLAVAALVLAQRRKGPGLAAALGAVADALADDVTMRRRVEADRAKPRATARAVTVITLLVVGVGLANGGYLAPYSTALGQLVLVGVTALFVAALAWMRAMTTARPRRRLLTTRLPLQAQP